MEIQGKVIKILSLQTGEGKNGTWKKQEFILETDTAYPKKICFSLWGDKLNMLQGAEGQSVTVGFDLESREYNGRWFTEAKAWKIEILSGSKSPDNEKEDLDWLDSQQGDTETDLPF